MKKLLGISLVAVLTAVPLMAGADPVATGTTPAHDDNAVAASAAPGYALAQANDNDSNFATAGYVKGAYNAAIKAVNKVATTANSAVQSVVEGDGNGQIKVDGTNINVHGLGSAAFTNSDAYDAAGTATTAIGALDATQSQTAGADGLALSVTQADGVITGISGSIAANTYDAYGAANTAKSDIEGKLDDGATGYDIDAKTLKIQGDDVATEDYVTGAIGTATANAATQDGVENTIKTATYSTTLDSGSVVTGTVAVPTTASFAIMETWGSDVATTNRTLTLGDNTNVSLANGTVNSATFSTTATAASYSEPE